MKKIKLIRKAIKGKIISPLLIFTSVSMSTVGLSPSASAQSEVSENGNYSISYDILQEKKEELSSKISVAMMDGALYAYRHRVIDDATYALINERALKVYENWSTFSYCDYETVVEVIKCLNGFKSSLSIEEVDEVVSEKINEVKEYARLNVLAKSQSYTCHLDVVDLVLDKNISLLNMENNLNGMLENFDEASYHCSRALESLAHVVSLDGLEEDLSMTSGSAAARLVWVRLTEAMSEIIGEYDESIMIKIDGENYSYKKDTYYPYAMFKNGEVLEHMAITAKRDDIYYIAETNVEQISK